MAIQKKKKRFFNVEIPLIRKETHLLAFSQEELAGKLIKYDLTRILKGKGALLQVIVKPVKGEEGKMTSIPRQLQILPFFIRRMVRKGTNYVEDSFSTETKDSQIRLKPFLVTRRKVPRKVRTALRNACKEELVKYAKSKNTEDIFRETLNGLLQKDISLKLKKIYPLSLCEMRIIKIEKYNQEPSPKAKTETKKPVEEKIQEKIKATSETKSEAKSSGKRKAE